MKIRMASLALLACMFCAPASAHQTYLISDIYKMRPGTDNFLVLKNGTFHESGYSITRKMSRDISLVTDGVRRTPPDDEVADVDKNPSYKSTYIKVFAEKPGTGLAGLAANPDYIALPAEMFANYLEHEGLVEELADFKANNKLGTIRERYTKHAKGVFQIGDKLTDDYKYKLDYKSEIFIDQNPGNVKVGDDISFQVFFDGKPLSNKTVYISNAKKEAVEGASIPDSSVYAIKTDAQGRGSFKVTMRDKWYMQLIHMQKVSDEDADYESNWSTFNFEII